MVVISLYACVHVLIQVLCLYYYISVLHFFNKAAHVANKVVYI